jgi:hypothetical protein
MFKDTYQCGPVVVSVSTPTKALRDLIATNFSLYNVAWTEVEAHLCLEVQESDATCEMLAGNYLMAQRTNVDATETGLYATSPSGASAIFTTTENRWSLTVPYGPLEIWPVTDLEHLLSLVLSNAWRQLGWTPMHVGAITSGKICGILCATSGGGKTTLTVAMIRRKWKTLGDDKLLLRKNASGTMELRALVHAFNLYPHTRDWFPEIGDLESLPHYSVWTEKRKVRIEDIWPGRTVKKDSPTHLVNVVLDDTVKDIEVTPLAQNEILFTLLRQTVIPTHPETARHIVQSLAASARQLKGITARIGPNAYESSDALILLEEALS